MTVTFGRLGRWFLVIGAAALLLALVGRLVFDGRTGFLVALPIGIIGLVLLPMGLLWTALQHRMFGSITALKRVAESGDVTTATIVGVRGTAGAIGAEPIVRLDLLINGKPVRRHVRIPFNNATEVRAGKDIPVRIDPAGSRAMIVDWDRDLPDS